MQVSKFGPLILAVAASICVAVTLAATASPQGGEFNEAIKAPKDLSPAELKANVREHFASIDDGSTTMLDMITDKAKHDRWVGLRWQVMRTIDDRRPVDLSEFGVTPGENGAYHVDATRFPQWSPLEQRMETFRNSNAAEIRLRELRERGFRESDVAAVRDYLQQHPFSRLAFAANRRLVESMAVKLKQRKQRNENVVDRELMLAYWYQRWQNVHEASRAWSLGLLNVLDPQRQRVLESYLMELPTATAFAPDDVEANMKAEAEHLIAGEYLKDFRKMEEESAQ